MLAGVYLRRTAAGKYRAEKTKMSLATFLERVAIDFQFARDGHYILNLQGGQLLGIFVPEDVSVYDVILSVGDEYAFEVDLEISE